MKVLHVAGEVAPYTTTGGLGVVLGSLPAAQRAQGVDARVLTPLYGHLDRSRLEHVRDVVVHLDRRDFYGALWRDGDVLFCDLPGLLDRETPYGSEDDPLRFAAFSKVAASIDADIHHLHDWQAAATSMYRRGPTVMTIHNLAYQGTCPWSWADRLGVPDALRSWEGIEFHGQVNLLKAGLVLADRITTVSPTYAREICTPELGMGLDGLLRHRAEVLGGVVNGLDPDAWDPAVDAPGGREAAAAALRAELGLEEGPLVVAIARAVSQKGLDLLAAAAPAVPTARFAVLADGDPAIERTLEAASKPGRFVVERRFDERLARRMYAAADFVAVPSRFEPCGLTQLIGQRYGALPVVRRTGGLADTVTDGVDGFSFDAATPEALADALRRAVGSSPETLARMRAAAAARDLSWAVPARAYIDIYQQICGGDR